MPENFFPLVDQYQHFYYKKNEVTNLSGGSGLLSTGRDYLKFANLLLNDGKLKNNRIFAKEVMKRIRTNSINSDIAANGVRSFAQMPTVGMGHSLAGSVIVTPNAKFVSNVGDFGWGGMASNYFWINFKKNYSAVFMTQLLPSASYPNRRELKKLVEFTGIPVFSTMQGKSAFDERHPLSLGAGCGTTTLAAHNWLKNSDVVLVLGSSLTRTPY